MFYLTCRQYTRHKSFVGGQIDAAVLEMWEESLDGSGEKICSFKALFMLSLSVCFLFAATFYSSFLISTQMPGLRREAD